MKIQKIGLLLVLLPTLAMGEVKTELFTLNGQLKKISSEAKIQNMTAFVIKSLKNEELPLVTLSSDFFILGSLKSRAAITTPESWLSLSARDFVPVTKNRFWGVDRQRLTAGKQGLNWGGPQGPQLWIRQDESATQAGMGWIGQGSEDWNASFDAHWGPLTPSRYSLRAIVRHDWGPWQIHLWGLGESVEGSQLSGASALWFGQKFKGWQLRFAGGGVQGASSLNPIGKPQSKIFWQSTLVEFNQKNGRWGTVGTLDWDADYKISRCSYETTLDLLIQDFQLRSSIEIIDEPCASKFIPPNYVGTLYAHWGKSWGADLQMQADLKESQLQFSAESSLFWQGESVYAEGRVLSDLQNGGRVGARAEIQMNAGKNMAFQIVWKREKLFWKLPWQAELFGLDSSLESRVTVSW